MRVGWVARLGLNWLTILAFASLAFPQNGAVAVVVRETNPVKQLTLPQLRKIFSGETRSWPGGQPIKIIARAPGAYERVVMLKLLRMSEGEYKQYWTAQVFRGEAQTEPVALFSNGMQKEAVVTFPGAIALVIPRDVKPGMKVLKIDGRLPDDDGYPVH